MSRKKQIFSSRFLNSLLNRPYGDDLYFITDGEYVKIGRANNVYKRLAQLQTGNPKALWVLAVIKDKGMNESWVHKTLSQYRVSNEWYILNENVKSFIKSLVKE